MGTGRCHQTLQHGRAGHRTEQRALDTRHGHRATGRHLVLNRRLSRQEHGIARHADAGEGRVAVTRREQIAHAPTPAGRRAFWRRALPVGLLVIV